MADKIFEASKLLWPDSDRQALDSEPKGAGQKVPRPSAPSQSKRTKSNRPNVTKQPSVGQKRRPPENRSKQEEKAASVSTPAIPVSNQNRLTAGFRNIVRDVTLLSGESKEEYHKFAGLVEADLNAQTATEFIFVSRFTHIQWDTRRIHIWRDQLRRSCVKEAFEVLMGPHLQGYDVAGRAALWNDGAPDKKATKLMKEAGLNETAIVAHGLATNLSLFEALDLMEARLEMRGHTILRELERHREAQGRYYRRSIQGSAVTIPTETSSD